MIVQKEQPIKGVRALVLGITFKENCPDIRNSRIIDVIHELEGFGIKVDVYDPYALSAEVQREYNLELISKLNKKYNTIILEVRHYEFQEIDITS